MWSICNVHVHSDHANTKSKQPTLNDETDSELESFIDEMQNLHQLEATIQIILRELKRDTIKLRQMVNLFSKEETTTGEKNETWKNGLTH